MCISEQICIYNVQPPSMILQYFYVLFNLDWKNITHDIWVLFIQLHSSFDTHYIELIQHMFRNLILFHL